MTILNQKPKAAVWLNTIEPVFFAKQNQLSCSFLILKESKYLVDFARKNFPASNLIFLKSKRKIVYPSFQDVVFQTDLVQQLRRNNIKYLVVAHRSSKEIEKWAKNNQIKLIVTLWPLQKKLEDKIYFDKLLAKYRILSPKTILAKNPEKYLKSNQTYVIQKSDSFGLFGTCFYRPGKNSPKLKINYKKILVREYLPGVPVGVSIFLDQAGNYFFSGLRLQCFIYQNGFPKDFIGIQWLPSNFFPSAVNKKINIELKKLVKLLKDEKFKGVANIDLLIYRHEPYIIECNPRLSTSTPQIFSWPELTKVKNSWQFFLNTFQGQDNIRIKKNKLPAHNFKGSVLDIDLPAKTKIRKILPVGVYKIEKHKIRFISQLVKDFLGNQNSFFLFHELSGQEAINRDFTLATIISNSPIFNLNSGELNQKGIKLFNYIKKEFIG